MAFQMNDLPNDPPGRDALIWQAVPGPPGQAVAVAVATPVVKATAVGERSAGGLFVDLPVDMQEELVNNYQRLLNVYFNNKRVELQARRGDCRAAHVHVLLLSPDAALRVMW